MEVDPVRFSGTFGIDSMRKIRVRITVRFGLNVQEDEKIPMMRGNSCTVW